MDYYFYYKSWDFIHRITKCEFNRRMFDLLIKKLSKNINNNFNTNFQNANIKNNINAKINNLI